MNIHEILIPIAHAAAEAGNAEGSSGGGISTLGLNWKLFLAQLVNFGIILLILWKWVFTPVTKALQSRTEKIEKSLKDAESITQEKEQFTKWREQEMATARQQAAGLITQAKVDASSVKDDILKKAKEEQDKLIDQAKKQIEAEKQQSVTSAKAEIAELVTMATEKILRKKLDVKTDSQLINETLKNLKK